MFYIKVGLPNLKKFATICGITFLLKNKKFYQLDDSRKGKKYFVSFSEALSVDYHKNCNITWISDTVDFQ